MTTAANTQSVLDQIEDSGTDVDNSGEVVAAYSYDASNYRVVPIGVVFPKDAAEIVRVLRICRETGASVITRGGGTSMAGNAVGDGIVLDLSRHLTTIHAVDEHELIADVDPGVVLSKLSAHVERVTQGRHTFAPDPSSKNRATIGGAIANDACGNHSVRYGRMTDHIIDLDVITIDGAQITLSRGGARATVPADAYSRARAEVLETSLRSLTTANMADIRLELSRIPRQVSGYHLSHLLPEGGFDIAKSLAGSEGTCAIVVRARVKIVPKPESALLVCLGYRDVVDAARDIETILRFNPAAVEGIDHEIVSTMRMRRGADSVEALPVGNSYLYVDLDGREPARVMERAVELIAALRIHGRMVDGRVVVDPAERAALWRVREDGAGLSSRPAKGGEAMAGWEDSAVAPAALADYLDDFRKLLDRYALSGIMYGHFGAGCMHIRITYDLRTDQGRNIFREFNREAAHLVVRHGGSLSGEHGDGRARSALLAVMYSPGVLHAFDQFRQAWDPTGLLNPRILTSAEPIDRHLALAGVPDREWRTEFTLNPLAANAAGADTWVHAVQSCIGVGRCRSDSGGVMCPSFRATQNETDSTRGRARALQEMVRGARSVREGWRSPDVRAALDLCLSCKACSSDCPAGVDMATYKSEFFSHFYQGRLRPTSHYSLGWLPLWLRLTRHISGLVNAVLATPLRRVVLRLGGLAPERFLPRFASNRSLRRALDGQPMHHDGQDVVLFLDSFTKGFRPDVAQAAVRVVESTGRTVSCEADACCGLTYISTGQLASARRLLERAIRRLDDGTTTPIVVLEPSCAAAFKKDAPELLGSDAARRVSERVQPFSEAVTDWVAHGWKPPTMPSEVTVQTHCHEYSVFGSASQTRALSSLGVNRIREATGCCGVAGNFGFEAQHFDVSMKVAAQSLIPAMNATEPTTPILTDGFSCSMQIPQIDSERQGLHLAELIEHGMRIQ